MPVSVMYRTSARATGGRDGHSATLDGAVDVKLTTPKELGGAGGTGVNPEQLFLLQRDPQQHRREAQRG